MPEFLNPDSGAIRYGDMIPTGRATRVLRATIGLLMATLFVTGCVGLAALILPIVVLRSVFGDGRRHQWRVDVPAPATDFLLRGRLVPLPRPAGER
jgi:hypothetical protein